MNVVRKTVCIDNTRSIRAIEEITECELFTIDVMN